MYDFSWWWNVFLFVFSIMLSLNINDIYVVGIQRGGLYNARDEWSASNWWHVLVYNFSLPSNDNLLSNNF